MIEIRRGRADRRPTTVWTSECDDRTYEMPVPKGFTPDQWVRVEEQLRADSWNGDDYLEARRAFLTPLDETEQRASAAILRKAELVQPEGVDRPQSAPCSG